MNLSTGQQVKATMCTMQMGTGTISRFHENLVWVQINGTDYPFYPHEITPV